ncbi:MAG: type II secretion system GspH family protein [Planctomycetaceae bacterium]|jgi:prepilin-type N-terminal cleavage/methylation domain-containing protein|nr:type II secretion system GspH family protein [Planctomycetaceae bacterium]
MTPTENITANSSPNPNKYAIPKPVLAKGFAHISVGANFIWQSTETQQRKTVVFSGMTLIELLVVLGILAALAGMTLNLVSEMNSSSRQDVTKNKLDQIETAIIGTPSQYSKFLNDMGRLPVAIGGEGNEFSELWNSNLFELASDLEVEYSGYEGDILSHFGKSISVTLNVGWKGPYLNVPNGKLYDGFGNNFWIAKAEDEDDVNDSELWNIFNSANSEILTIIKFGSLGEDNTKATSQDSNWRNIDDKREIKVASVSSNLHVKILLCDSSTDQTTWLPPSKISDPNGFKKYAIAQQHYQNDIVLPDNTNSNALANDLFICLPSPATTLTTNIDWSRFQIVEKVNAEGNPQYWRWLPNSHKSNRMRVVIFSPYVSQTAAATPENENETLKTPHIRITTANYNSDNNSKWNFTDEFKDTTENPYKTTPNTPTDQTYISEVTFTNLTPGIRKIFAYGYIVNSESETYSNARHSNLQTIELKAGENFITIYLNEFL